MHLRDGMAPWDESFIQSAHGPHRKRNRRSLVRSIRAPAILDFCIKNHRFSDLSRISIFCSGRPRERASIKLYVTTSSDDDGGYRANQRLRGEFCAIFAAAQLWDHRMVFLNSPAIEFNYSHFGSRSLEHWFTIII